MSTDTQQLTVSVSFVNAAGNEYNGAIESDAIDNGIVFTDGSTFPIDAFENFTAGANDNGLGVQIINNAEAIKGKTVEYFVFDNIKKTAPAGLTFNSTLGVEDEIVESTKIYPIPVKQRESLKIESPFSIADRWEGFEIYDIQGKQVYKQELFDNGYAAEAYGIDTSNLEPGVYILRATSQKG